MKVFYSNHPDDVKKYDTEELREKFHVGRIFSPDSINLYYSHQDRIIFGGIMPSHKVLNLEAAEELRAEYFLERRELGAINIGGKGVVTVDNTEYLIDKYEAIYVGKGSKKLSFSSESLEDPAKFYIASCPAHRSCPTRKISYDEAIHTKAGSAADVNKRQINKYIHDDILDTCQLAMGMTAIEEGSAWNTMPCHIHEMRMEVYMYFDMEEDARVFHFMGLPHETRHIVVKNEEVVISPCWSIHAGVGTKNYKFIWSMCGENKDYDDMDNIPMDVIR
ncbi:5-dehydro-4-deoxy-D-glucuronate isomerase [Acetomicrobium mobile]|jgi:4-deoxy-L-threo-5-hexosulose-uronate ketol-isomerase|uniref:5-dehydro-4-deoxy-D-glucuronate isomerase n=1 Tax=Acetomicrobium mobile TaxID=97477 RepID=UPI0026F35F6B|nr:5-dehydro-4-deoxy-D-glucuronate isomerase [Acetomicrobium mobile]